MLAFDSIAHLAPVHEDATIHDVNALDWNGQRAGGLEADATALRISAMLHDANSDPCLTSDASSSSHALSSARARDHRASYSTCIAICRHWS